MQEKKPRIMPETLKGMLVSECAANRCYAAAGTCAAVPASRTQLGLRSSPLPPSLWSPLTWDVQEGGDRKKGRLRLHEKK